MFEVGYTYGWRHEELLALRVRQVNQAAGTIRLEPGTTKNSEGRFPRQRHRVARQGADTRIPRRT